jgi:hypothetical protein
MADAFSSYRTHTSTGKKGRKSTRNGPILPHRLVSKMDKVDLGKLPKTEKKFGISDLDRVKRVMRGGKQAQRQFLAAIDVNGRIAERHPTREIKRLSE